MTDRLLPNLAPQDPVRLLQEVREAKRNMGCPRNLTEKRGYGLLLLLTEVQRFEVMP